MDLSNFPSCLFVAPRSNSPLLRASEADINWRRKHNRAMDAFVSEMHENPNDLRRNERAILSLAAGVLQWCKSSDIGTGEDADYYASDIVRALSSAFTDALNYDLGRLDGGTLSKFICELHKQYTGEEL